MMLRQNELKSLLNDKHSGSQDILIKLNKLLLKYITNTESLNKIVQAAGKAFNQFQVVSFNINKYEKLISEGQLNKLESFLLGSFQLYEIAYKRIFDQLYLSYPYSKLILTISNSRTVIEVLKLWKQKTKNLQVVVCESRPKFEGRIAGKELAKISIDATLIAEALMPMYISKCDLVLIGADIILKNKNVVNKTGSLSAAIIAKHYSKPFVVAASSEKFSNYNRFKIKKENPLEIFPHRTKKLDSINIYFEIIPKHLITKIYSN